MTKAEAKKKLIKDCVIAVIASAVAAIVFITMAESGVVGGIILGIVCAGLPFGWRLMSNIFTALSFYTIIIKAILSVLIGWVALPIIIITDIVKLSKAE